MLRSAESEALEVLLAGGVGALRDALAGVGERAGAFRLLAADAWVTYACERALEEADPATALRRILDGVGEESGKVEMRDG
jgi:hypothetical protein